MLNTEILMPSIFCNTLQQASIVAPVVITSSIKTTCLFLRAFTSVTSNTCSTFSQRSYLFFFVCVVVKALRMSSVVFVSISNFCDKPMANSSL